MKTLTTITGRKLKVSANHKMRRFTIQTESATYRTYPMTKEEFISCLNNTGNDWHNFLKTDEYYYVK